MSKQSGWFWDESDGIGAPGIDRAGLYAIYYFDKPVYIGSTSSIMCRLRQHLSSYRRVITGLSGKGSRVDHYLFGERLGSTRLPEIYPLRYKWAMTCGEKRNRVEREMRLIGRVKPMLNKAGVKAGAA